jgi:predicted metal-dependent phosphoesterase TrpH
LIDLHLHTTASDGRLSPVDLVACAVAAGIRVLSVTDHDTVAGVASVREASAAAGIASVNGIEITSVHDGRDVHMLGYFIDADDEDLASFLTEQRQRRANRIREIGVRLARLGVAIDVETLIDRAGRKPGASVGRPAVARALMAAGHVASMQEAFDRFLATGRPAFVPRAGESPADVIARIHSAGGLASMAHPGVTGQPALMSALVHQKLDAIEVYHPDHPPEIKQHLLSFAVEHRLLVTGGSDFHGEDDTRDRPLGRTSLPAADFENLRRRSGQP